MRWIWIDSLVAFSPGQSASSVKNVTLAEEILHDHFPHWPVFPPTLMVEGMAQTAGILVGESRGFRENVVLAKLRHVELARYAFPGQQIRYDATIVSVDDQAAITSGKVLIEGEPAGTIDLIFSHVNGANAVGLPEHNFVFTDQFMHLVDDFRATHGIDLGNKSAGGGIQPPDKSDGPANDGSPAGSPTGLKSGEMEASIE
ncbi:MAG: beta-hydroxyacyl-ACP dehydratase [Phycisphaerae bacterium]